MTIILSFYILIYIATIKNKYIVKEIEYHKRQSFNKRREYQIYNIRFDKKTTRIKQLFWAYKMYLTTIIFKGALPIPMIDRVICNNK